MKNGKYASGLRVAWSDVSMPIDMWDVLVPRLISDQLETCYLVSYNLQGLSGVKFTHFGRDWLSLAKGVPPLYRLCTACTASWGNFLFFSKPRLRRWRNISSQVLRLFTGFYAYLRLFTHPGDFFIFSRHRVARFAGLGGVFENSFRGYGVYADAQGRAGSCAAERGADGAAHRPYRGRCSSAHGCRTALDLVALA